MRLVGGPLHLRRRRPTRRETAVLERRVRQLSHPHFWKNFGGMYFVSVLIGSRCPHGIRSCSGCPYGDSVFAWSARFLPSSALPLPSGGSVTDTFVCSAPKRRGDDAAVLQREVAERRAQQATERRTRLENQIETKRKLTEKWRQYTCTPIRYFSTRDTEEKKYAAFDEATGLPTRRAAGEALGEKEQKKLAKELARYAKVHEEFVAKGGEGWLAEQEKELASLCQALESL
ncbi:hypothetical protein C3747_78g11 [Trypanosoma cruzi]|uniref:Uncharacterized protein n=1 Tax=Trypanosoma cruzi TaxID=5693 RepID=A0A2V2WNR8_TRYCR|nr:hypothetical protein ECC02_002414 [Trypanosoma cruzi]KAF8300386.1 putative helicase [Trypanosoma cruzi]PWV09463.1 hypothetical protein C3747_78g11 [Trypanosoma cruzi]